MISFAQMTLGRNVRLLLVAVLLVSAWTGVAPVGLASGPTLAVQTDLEKMVANLKSPDVLLRRKAAKDLGERRFREATAPLVDAARTDSDPEVRAHAVEALGRIKNFDAVPAMTEVLKDPATLVRRAAIRGLISFYIESEIGFVFAERSGFNYLNPFLDTDGPTIVEPYTQVDPRITDALAGLMRNDADVNLRRAGVRALGVLRANSQVPALAAALQVDPDLRVDVFRVFIKLGDPENGNYAVPYFNEADRNVRAEAIFTAGYLRTRQANSKLIDVYNLGEDKRGFKGTIKDFFKQIPERQYITLQALSHIADPASKDIFVQNLRASDNDRRCMANEGLARMNDPSFLEEISRNRLKEGNEDVKLAQAFALYRLGRPEFLDAIVQKLDAVILGGQAENYLVDVLKTSDLHRYLRTSTLETTIKLCKALGKIGTSDDVPALEPLLKDANPRVFNAANLAIQRIKLRQQARAGELPARPPVPPTEEGKRPRRVGQ
ncbi:MAG: HEAT repeat domain-containing protein [Blastocatellia bacterium]|nr:HEAT repeat domain-containing protein [Blastocatellia bacterium]